VDWSSGVEKVLYKTEGQTAGLPGKQSETQKGTVNQKGKRGKPTMTISGGKLFQSGPEERESTAISLKLLPVVVHAIR
jgi:hypothetical protein